MSSKHAAEEATGTEPADKKPRTEETAGSAGAQNASDGASGPGLFDHLSLPVSDYKKSKEFYSGVLGVLGCTVQMEFGEGCGIGKKEGEFWISGSKEPVKSPEGQHLAFRCGSRVLVDKMYNKAIELGAKDNGKPGLRPDYHPNYYAAFFLDPDGHRIEAVCHQPEEGGKKEGKVIQEEIAEKAGEAGNELEAEAGAETEVLA